MYQMRHKIFLNNEKNYIFVIPSKKKKRERNELFPYTEAKILIRDNQKSQKTIGFLNLWKTLRNQGISLLSS